MSSDTSQADAREERLDGVIVEYLRAAAAGHPPDRTELLARHPDLAPDLDRFLADQEELTRRAAPLREVASSLPAGDLGTSVLSGLSGGGPWMPQAIGPYEILGEVGRGGMGVVYRARHRALNRTVALKMIAPGAASPALLARFRTEARATARLQHPNIVQVFEVGEHEGLPYLVLEFVEGGSLAQQLNGQPVPPIEAARLAETLARAVQAAHQGGVVHRDLKPANVLLTNSPGSTQYSVLSTQYPEPPALPSESRLNECVPKITDFGLARHLDDGATVQTETGAILGTPSYMAPEQAEARGRPFGPAADVYSLGAILYELLTGRPPFRGVTRLDTLQQLLRDAPIPPRRLQPLVPRDLETVCLKCLEKDPKKRYPTAEALADDLRRFLDGLPVRARRAGPVERTWRRCRRQPVLASLSASLVLALIVGAALVIWQWRRAETNFRTAEASYQEAERLRGEAVAHEAEVEASFRLAHEVVKEVVARVNQRRGLFDARGLQPLRKELLAKARGYYQKFLEKRAADPTLRRELAETSADLAALTSDIGSRQEALDDYRRALGLYEGLLADHPDDFALRARQASLSNDMGVLLDTLGRRREARDTFRRAQAILGELLRSRPDDERLDFTLADTHNNLGALYAVTNEPQLALESFEAARKLQKRLLDRHPDDPDLTARLASSHNNIGVLLSKNGRAPEALGPMQEGLKLRLGLAKRFHDNLTAQSALAESYRNVADLLRGRRQYQESLDHLKKGHAILERLVREARPVIHYRNQLGASFLNVGLTHLAGGDPGKALAPLEEGRKVYDALAREHPEYLYFRAELGGLWYFIADAHAQMGHAEPALNALAQARAAQVPLANEHPEHAEYSSQLARTLHGLGALNSQLGRPARGRKALRAAINRERHALERAPQEPRYRQALAKHYAALAALERRAGQPQAAAAAVEGRLRLRPNDPGELYAAACELALTAAAAPPADRQTYTDQALGALRRAVAAGFRDAERTRTNPALASLRPLPEFQRLLAEMKKAPSSRK